jgi:hypothetical protein
MGLEYLGSPCHIIYHIKRLIVLKYKVTEITDDDEDEDE